MYSLTELCTLRGLGKTGTLPPLTEAGDRVYIVKVRTLILVIAAGEEKPNSLHLPRGGPYGGPCLLSPGICIHSTIARSQTQGDTRLGFCEQERGRHSVGIEKGCKRSTKRRCR